MSKHVRISGEVRREDVLRVVGRSDVSRGDLNVKSLLCLVFYQERQLGDVEAVGIAGWRSESVAALPPESGVLTGAGKIEICSKTGGCLGEIGSLITGT